MEYAPPPAPPGARSLFWRIWEKAWWLFALAFLGACAWAVHSSGWLGAAGYFCTLIACIGAFVLLYGWRARRLAQESRSWPEASGLILRSAVEKQVQRSEDGLGGNFVYYYPNIEYQYEVQGRTYFSNKLLLARVNYPEAEAGAAVARYPAGLRVPVYYHPKRPRTAVLEPGLAGHEREYRIPLLVGAGLLAAGAGLGALLRLLAQ